MSPYAFLGGKKEGLGFCFLSLSGGRPFVQLAWVGVCCYCPLPPHLGGLIHVYSIISAMMPFSQPGAQQQQQQQPQQPPQQPAMMYQGMQPGMPMSGMPMPPQHVMPMPQQGMPMQGMPMPGMPMPGMPMPGVPMGTGAMPSGTPSQPFFYPGYNQPQVAPSFAPGQSVATTSSGVNIQGVDINILNMVNSQTLARHQQALEQVLSKSGDGTFSGSKFTHAYAST